MPAPTTTLPSRSGIEELLARVRANLRRVPEESEQESLIEVGDFRIDSGGA